MGFFNSLYQVGKNNDNFKKWEQDQRDNAARREELYKQNRHTPQEIEKARELGKTIIDVVDVMDNHSENVAENVETATAPIVAFAPLAAFFGSALALGKFILPKHSKKILEARQALIENADNMNLHEEIKNYFNNADEKFKSLTEAEKSKKASPAKKNGWARPSAFTNKKAIEKIKDPVLKSKAMSVFKKYAKETSKSRFAMKAGGWGVLGMWIGTFIGANIYATKLQVDSSRIARYQAREILSDPKAFVNYTPEQIAKANEYVKEHPELLKKKKKEKLKSGMFKSIVNVLKDRKAYKQAKAQDTDTSKKVTRKLSEKEILKAKKDQEVIQRTVRLINNEAEKYSENMETTAVFLMGSTPFLGMGIGYILNKIANLTGVTDKIVKNVINKNSGAEAKTAFEEFSKIKKGAPGYTKKYVKFADKVMDEVHGFNFDAAESAVKRDWFTNFKKLSAVALAHKKVRAIVMAGLTGITTGIAGALIALKLQKSSARAGRYTAKRELEKDPRNFIGYTDEDLEKVKNVKGDKPTFMQKVKGFVMFVPTVLKQYYAYNKYKKHEFKQNQVINEQLQKQDVSDEQLREAKNLQRKLFNTFEKVDDNSQQYSESMEAAIEILQPFVITGGFMGVLSPFIYLGIQAVRGKKNPAQLLNKIAGYLSSGSKIMESKYYKKYVASIAQNIEHKVGNVDVKDKYLGTLLKGVDLKNDVIPLIFSKMKTNLQEAGAILREKTPEEQKVILDNMRYAFSKYTDKLDAFRPAGLKIEGKTKMPSFKEDIDKIFSYLINNPTFSEKPTLRADMLDILTGNTKYIKEKMTNEQFADAISELSYAALKNQKDINIKNILEASAQKIEDANLKELFENAASQADVITPEKIREFVTTSITKDNYTKLMEVLPASPLKTFNYKISELPTAAQDLIKMTERANSFLPNSQPIKELENIKRILNIKNPKTALSEFKKTVEKMSDTAFEDKMGRIGFSSMDKKTCLEIIPKLEKIFERIPEKELKQIMDALVKEFNEHPDEMLKLINSGRIKEIFNTPYLRKVLSLLGLANTVVVGSLTLFVAFLLADLQLKAGRLGVMKAIDSLKDPAYYADIEPETEKQTVEQNKSKNLLKSIKMPLTK